jgi:hypothetical protein
MDQMVLLPVAGFEEHGTELERPPWLERRNIGRVRAWFRTVGQSMVQPFRLMRSVPVDSSTGDALWFATVSNFIYACGLVLPWIVLMLVSMAWGWGGGGARTFEAAFACFIPCGLLIGWLLWTLLWVAATHILLRISGPVLAGTDRTYQAICYSSGANALTAIPCFGIYIGWIWWLVSAALMVKEAQKVGGTRATLATLALPVTLFLLAAGGYAYLVHSVLSGPMAAYRSMQSAVSDPRPQSVLTAFQAYLQDHSDQLPTHAIELVHQGYLQTDDLILASTGTIEDDVPIGDGGLTLDDYNGLTARQQKAVTNDTIAAQPPDVIAHRLGDFVFTFHGIDPTQSDPGIWIAVVCPDPDVNPPLGSNEMIGVIHLGGFVNWFPQSQLVAELHAQNALRTQHQLPPLPDPTAITHQAPAVK